MSPNPELGAAPRPAAGPRRRRRRTTRGRRSRPCAARPRRGLARPRRPSLRSWTSRRRRAREVPRTEQVDTPAHDLVRVDLVHCPDDAVAHPLRGGEPEPEEAELRIRERLRSGRGPRSLRQKACGQWKWRTRTLPRDRRSQPRSNGASGVELDPVPVELRVEQPLVRVRREDGRERRDAHGLPLDGGRPPSPGAVRVATAFVTRRRPTTIRSRGSTGSRPAARGR